MDLGEIRDIKILIKLTPAALWSKQKGGWGALVTVAANHVGSTLALPAVRVTDGAERSLRVALTR